jgi:hypothetical protein
MRRVHSDGAGRRVADEKQHNPVPRSELCHLGFASLVLDACDRRGSSERNPQEVFLGVAR